MIWKYLWHKVKRHNTVFLYGIAGMDLMHCIDCDKTNRRRSKW